MSTRGADLRPLGAATTDDGLFEEHEGGWFGGCTPH